MDTSKYMVFDSANVKNIILRIKNTKEEQNTTIKIAESSSSFKNNIFKTRILPTSIFKNLKNTRFETKEFENLLSIKETVDRDSTMLEKICLISYGVRVNHKTDKNKPKKKLCFRNRKKRI